MPSFDRVIVTGANGAGKSHFARALALSRPDVPVISYDALKLTTQWRQRPKAESAMDLARAIAQPAWILEGGPSLLPVALPHAQVVIWLDPGVALRAWRLARRPWLRIGRTRPELPPGNDDWPWQQYRFALRSLRAAPRFRAEITRQVSALPPARILHCRSRSDIAAALEAWLEGR